MDPETDAPEGGTEGADTSSQVDAAEVQNADDTAAQPSGADDAAQADDAGEATEPKRVPWFQKRIDEVTAKKYEAEREAAYWRGIAEGRTPAQQPLVQAQPEGPPREDQYENWDDYQAALIDYRVEQRLRAAQVEQQRETVARTFQERLDQARAKFADYDSVVRDPTLPISPVMADVIRESDVGPEVAYHLGTNRQEAERIASLSPHRQAAELGRIEAMLQQRQAAPPPTNRTPPPPPPKTVSGLSTGLTKAPEDMSMAEYIAARKAGTI